MRDGVERGAFALLGDAAAIATDLVLAIAAHPLPFITGTASIVGLFVATIRGLERDSLMRRQEALTTWKELADARAAALAERDSKLQLAIIELEALRKKEHELEAAEQLAHTELERVRGEIAQAKTDTATARASVARQRRDLEPGDD